ncbi:MAG: radical SAM protein [Bacteroidales bacterium]|nr:radical SAM protein [Candidatus Latescibacterota bacterium]
MTLNISRLLIDSRSVDDPVTVRMLAALPGVETTIMDDIDPSRVEGGPGAVVLTHLQGAFIKDFPVTPGAPPCGEKYIVTMANCPFFCSYCYLQSYLEHDRITVFTDTDRMKEEIAATISCDRPARMTTGEFGDSLALDSITGITLDILPLFEGTGTILEVRTKSDSIDHLIPPAGDHLMMTWTLSPQEAISREEPGTATLARRLKSIEKAVRAGTRVSVRLDPVIPSYYTAESYFGLVRDIRAAAGKGGIRRFELGIVRFPPGLWEIAAGKKSGGRLIKGEYFNDLEGKKRYYRPERVRIYRELGMMVREEFPEAAIELSMEDREVWEDAGITLQ